VTLVDSDKESDTSGQW